MIKYLLYDGDNILKSITAREPDELPGNWTIRSVDVPEGWVWNHTTGQFAAPVVPESQKQRTSLEGQADAALVRNKTFIDTPNAQLTNAQVVNHLKDLTRQVNALIRLSQDRLLVENTDT
jgi:hypothetical protein